MNKTLIFLDIDGTLAMYNRVPRSAARACRRARQNGRLLYICTGRSRSQISPGILKLGFDGVVSSGGACIEVFEGAGGKDPKVLYHAVFERTLLDRLTVYLDGYKTPYMFELSGKTAAGPYFKPWFDAFYARKPRNFRAFMEKNIMRILLRGMIRDGPYSRDDVRKVVFMETPGLRFEDVRREFQGECELFRNSIPVEGVTGGEISPAGVHKGAALDRVRDYYGIPRENTFALGDSDNDRTMLERAGLGVAMGNAHESLKRIAGDVTAPIEKDGLAAAFKKHGLI
ncbi:MAG: Cof-type HAD-IIB family hydrolase [Spirochaetaceae bacterium]|jgi:Cof subfamily protein (haloacid dehalogenase superfamily)|nr:Cof-type HAD-IIB family hydrolase [Spirochaetaceae bacterium]